MNDTSLLIITGYSGAGMSSTLNALEDLGYHVIDNFPLGLLEPLMQLNAPIQPIAVGIDTRTMGFNPKALMDTTHNLSARIVFITCNDRTLHKRFTETRRRHPLATDRPVSSGIEMERQILGGLQEQADLVIDTSDFSVHDLRRVIAGHFGENAHSKLTVTLMSFGFKNGLPREADIVMDVRFLKNPHWEDDLRDLTGLDEKVGTYIQSDEDFESFLGNFKTLLTPLLGRYTQEGKSYLTLAIGCTGGKHRSVYTIERLMEWFRTLDIPTQALHRDL